MKRMVGMTIILALLTIALYANAASYKTVFQADSYYNCPTTVEVWSGNTLLVSAEVQAQEKYCIIGSAMTDVSNIIFKYQAPQGELIQKAPDKLSPIYYFDWWRFRWVIVGYTAIKYLNE